MTRKQQILAEVNRLGAELAALDDEWGFETVALVEIAPHLARRHPIDPTGATILMAAACIAFVHAGLSQQDALLAVAQAYADGAVIERARIARARLDAEADDDGTVH